MKFDPSKWVPFNDLCLKICIFSSWEPSHQSCTFRLSHPTRPLSRTYLLHRARCDHEHPPPLAKIWREFVLFEIIKCQMSTSESLFFFIYINIESFGLFCWFEKKNHVDVDGSISNPVVSTADYWSENLQKKKSDRFLFYPWFLRFLVWNTNQKSLKSKDFLPDLSTILPLEHDHRDVVTWIKSKTVCPNQSSP